MLKIYKTLYSEPTDDYVFIHDIINDDLGNKYLLAETINANNFNLTGDKKVYVVDKDYKYNISKHDYYAIILDKERIAYLDDYDEGGFFLVKEAHCYGDSGGA